MATQLTEAYLGIIEGEEGGRGGGGVFNGPCVAGTHNGLVVQHCMREAGQLQGDNQLVLPALLQLLHDIPSRVAQMVSRHASQQCRAEPSHWTRMTLESMLLAVCTCSYAGSKS